MRKIGIFILFFLILSSTINYQSNDLNIENEYISDENNLEQYPLKSGNSENISSQVTTNHDNPDVISTDPVIEPEVSGQIYQGESVRTDYLAKNVTVKDYSVDASRYLHYLDSYPLSGVDYAIDSNYLYTLDSSGYVDRYDLDTMVIDTDNFIDVSSESTNYPYVDIIGFFAIAVNENYIFIVFEYCGGFSCTSPGYNDAVLRFNIDGSGMSEFSTSQGAGSTSSDVITTADVLADDSYFYMFTVDTISVVKKYTVAGSATVSYSDYSSTEWDYQHLALDDNYLYATASDSASGQLFYWSKSSATAYSHSLGGSNDYKSGIAADSKHFLAWNHLTPRELRLHEASSTLPATADIVYDFAYDLPSSGDGNLLIQGSFLYAYYGSTLRLYSLTSESQYTSVSSSLSQAKQDLVNATYINTFSSETYHFNQTIEFVLYDLANPSEVGMLYQLSILDQSGITTLNDGSHSISLDSNSVYGSSELKLLLSYSFAAGEGYIVQLALFDTGLNTLVSSIDTYAWNDIDPLAIYFDIDYIWAESQEVSGHLRSEYYYTDSPEQRVHTMSIEVYDYRIPLTVYAPLSWNLTSVSPLANWEWDDTNQYWSITNTIPATYNLVFNSGTGWGVDYTRQPYLVALNDHSSDYMQSSSFEDGDYSDIYKSTVSSYQFDTVELSTEIVFDGSFSLHLKDTNSSDREFVGLFKDPSDYNYFDSYLYISFSYYRNSTDTFRFYVKDNSGAWTNTILDGEQNRWHIVFFYVEEFQTIRLDPVANAAPDYYFDDFFIGKASGTAETVGYSEVDLGIHAINWDGRKNKGLSYYDFELSLWDRTASQQIWQGTVTTDQYGIAIYNYQGTLEMKEYTLQAYSIDNHFMNPTLELSDFTVSDVTSSIDSFEDLTFTTIATDDGDSRVTISIDPDFDFSLDLVDIVYFKLRSTATSDVFRLYLYDTSPSIIAYDDPSDITADTWFEYQMTSSDFISWTTGDIDQVVFYIDGGSATIDLYDFHFIQAQKSYFTPISSGYLPYSYETKISGEQNYWDYSENTDETVWETAYGSETVENGYFETLKNNAQNFVTPNTLNTLSIDASKWDTAIFRIYVNESDWDISFDFRAGSYYADPNTVKSVADEYITVDVDLSSRTGWSGTVTELFVIIEKDTTNVIVRLDHFYLIRESHSNGYAWEFEEPDYTDTLTANSNPTVFTTIGRSLKITADDSWDGLVYSGDDLDLSNFDYLEFMAMSPDEIHTHFTFTDDGAWSGNTGEITLSSSWEIYHYELDATKQAADAFYSSVATYGHYGTWYIAYIRFGSYSTVDLYETYDSFTFSSENDTSLYYYENDENSGYATDLELISKNMTVDSHNFSYTRIYDSSVDSNLVQLASAWYYYEYVIAEDDFQVSVLDFSLSDDYVQTYVTANYDYSYVVKENGSSIATGSGLATGTSIQSQRDNTPGVLIIYTIEFTNGTDTITFTSSYSNAATIPEDDLTVEYFYSNINDFTFSIAFGTNWANQTAYVYQNSSLIGSVAEDTTTLFNRGQAYDIYYNITVLIGSYLYEFGYYNAPAVEEDGLVLYYTDFSYNLDGYLYFDWATNWANSTATILDNSTSLGSGSESSLAVVFSPSVGLHNITIYLNVSSTNYYILYTSFTIGEVDLSLYTYYYDIVVLDGDGYIFQDFPLMVYYNSTVLSRNMLPLPGNETFDENLLTFGNEQGFSFSALNITVKESVSSNTFVVLAYLDLVKIYFENSGLYASYLNISRIPGVYNSTKNETVYVPRGGFHYWLPTGNYSAVVYEMIENLTSTVDNDIILENTGFISFMRVSTDLDDLSFDASSSTRDYNPRIENDVTLLTPGQAAAVGISSSLITYFLLSKVADEFYKWIRFKATGKTSDKPLTSNDFQLKSSPQRDGRIKL